MANRKRVTIVLALTGVVCVVFVCVALVIATAPTRPIVGASPDRPTFAQEADGKEAVEQTNGEAALLFRHLQKVDENGDIPTNALVHAVSHVDLMKTVVGTNGSNADVAGITPASWEWLGPGNIGGRIRSILINPTTPDTMWVGSVTGGIFKTTNGGATWSNLDDFLANLAVSSLVASASAPNTIYAGTGENTSGNRGWREIDGRGNRGAGVFKSTNGGTSWSQLASTANSNWWYTNRLAVHPTNADTLLAATWAGIYRTQNGGTSWALEFPTTGIEVVQDVDFDPTNGNNAIAGGWNGRALYSTNGGVTWQLATGIPTANAGRVEVAYAASNPSVTYASVDLNGGAIYRSTNGGQSYTFAGPTPTDVNYLCAPLCQGSYDNALWVSPSNPDRVIVGGIDLYQSTNQGATLTKISDWTVNQTFVQTGNGPDSAHADHHVIVSNPNYPTNLTVFFGNDGGIFKTTNVTTVTPTAGWQELNNNLGITQFYGAAGNVSSGKIIGGTQDNGTLRYNGATETWNMTFGGDGGFDAADPTNPNYLYGEYVFGHVFRSSDGGVNGDYISGQFWNGSAWVCKAAPYQIPDACNETANFIAPFVLDPTNPQRLLVGGVSLWRTNDARTANTTTTGPTWASIKPPIVNNSPISAIDIDDHNSDLVYVGYNNGSIYRTTNATAVSPTWMRVDLATMPARMVLDLTIDPNNSNVVYATFGGFSADNVWRLSDGNLNWTDRTGSGSTGLPDVPARNLLVNPTNSDWLYLGTETGVFASQDGGLTWGVPQDGPANVPVDELFMMGNDLVAATYGRGVWRANLAAASLPGAPSGVTAAAGNAQATVSWTPPASDGGSAITNYVVTPFIGAVAQTSKQVGNVTTTTVTGLTNGTTYTFKVAAVNAVGTGPQSAASNAVLIQAPPAHIVVADFNGDGKTDVSVFRPSEGRWYAVGSPFLNWGLSSDIPVPGNYKGQTTTDAAVYRPSEGRWYVNGGAFTTWGTSGDIPVPGDYNGDGTTDIAVFRPSEGRWYVNGGAFTTWGTSGDIPVPGDYNGDGTTDVAVFRPSEGRWYINGQPSVTWGVSGDIPVPGDYNGDGTTDIAVYRPAEGRWYIRGGAFTTWGTAGDIPEPGDYDGNGTTDIAVFRPSEGRWYVNGGAFTTWGVSTDKPLPLPYAIRHVFFP
jgi:Fibronectin type III domain/FG-GAP-like repeat